MGSPHSLRAQPSRGRGGHPLDHLGEGFTAPNGGFRGGLPLALRLPATHDGSAHGKLLGKAQSVSRRGNTPAPNISSSGDRGWKEGGAVSLPPGGGLEPGL